jgi:hypothetical protein
MTDKKIEMMTRKNGLREKFNEKNNNEKNNKNSCKK